MMSKRDNQRAAAPVWLLLVVVVVVMMMSMTVPVVDAASIGVSTTSSRRGLFSSKATFSTTRGRFDVQATAILLRGGGAKSKSSAAVVDAAPSSTTGASIPSEVFNLVKAIVGVGVLSLPAGVATFASAKSTMVYAAVLIATMGMLSGFGFSLIGRVCSYTNARSYREAWQRSIGEGSSWIAALSTTVKTFLACLACSMVLGDTFSMLLKTDRTQTLLAVTTLILLPLCLLKELKKLSPFSLLGVLGMVFTALSMTIRYFDGTYNMPDGEFASQLGSNYQPLFQEQVTSVFTGKTLILLCMLSTAFMCHFSAPRYYWELENPTLPCYNSVVTWSFGISILLMACITTLGFITFGMNSSGLILNNYHTTDVWMSASRIAVSLALVFSYPLAFVGCRDGILELLQVKDRSDALLNSVTVGLLGLITSLACVLKNVSFVLALGGATLGNALSYLYPALMYRAVIKKQDRTDESKVAVFVATASAVLGVVMGVIGTKIAISGTGGGH